MTAEAKRLARARGGLIANRRLTPEEATIDVGHRLESLAEIGLVEAQLRREIREKRWSHRDAALQVQLLLAAIRRVEATEKLRQARAVLTQRHPFMRPVIKIAIAPAFAALMPKAAEPRATAAAEPEALEPRDDEAGR